MRDYPGKGQQLYSNQLKDLSYLLIIQVKDFNSRMVIFWKNESKQICQRFGSAQATFCKSVHASVVKWCVL